MKYDNLILASASPRRQELLKYICKDFTVKASKVSEDVPFDMPSEEVPQFLATLKAKDVASVFPNSLIIGADTCVILNNKILGKPKNREEAFGMLSDLSGKTHKVITGCALVKGDKSISFATETSVEFFNLTAEEINEYLDTAEPYDKAGSYGIQGMGSLFVKAIDGDYFNVVGLPIAQLKRVMEAFNNLTK